MRKCELCECLPRMYCESDQAYLCWECDEKVHRANFLVAKHSRSLLCHVCQSLTPWKASGPKLGPTVSVCDACVTSAHCEVHDTELVKRENNQSERTSGDDDLDEDDYDDDEEDGDEEEEEEYDDIEVDYDEEEDDENQVVPWSGDSQYPPPPPVVSSSCSSSCQEDQVSLKRGRGFGEFYSDDEIGCSTSQPCSRAAANEEANYSPSSFRPLKQARKTVYRDIHLGEEGHVVCYEMADIERKLGYGRNSLITLALLLGGDYSKGVHGLGPEEACRIVKSIADNVVLERIASEGLSLVKKARNSRNLNGENQFLEVIDAYTKPKCHSADSDAVYRVLVQHPILHTKLHQICAQFFEWPSEKTDEYILPKIAERDLRRFANLRTSSAAVELPLHKMPVKCPVTGIIKPRRVRGTECFEVSWEESYGLKSSVVPAELIESACPEKIVEFKERKAAPRTKKSKPRSRIDQKLQALSLDIESGSSSVPSVAFSSKTVMPENMTAVSEVNFTRHDPFLDAESESDVDGNSNAAMPLYQTALESESKADGNARIPSNPAAPTNANYEVIDLISPSPAHCRNVSRSQKMSNQAISVIDLSDSDTERSPEHERKARELRLFLASIPD